MNILAFLVLLFGLQAVCLVVGKKASKKSIDKDDYFLAGKSVRFFPLMMTFLATQVGGGLILGASEEACRFGWTVLLYPLGAALGLILLGMGIGRKLAQFQVSTVAQIFEVAYRSLMLRRIASILSILSLFMILVAQIIASHKFLASLGINNLFLFMGFWGMVIFYTVQGGLRAVIATDIVQAAFFTLVFLFCFAFAYFGNNISILEISSLEHFAVVPSKLCGWLLMPLLFMVIEQDMGQRCFAGHTARIVSKASLWAGIITLFICVIPIFFGVWARSVGLEASAGASILMAAVEKMTNPWVAALVGSAILVAIVSTADSLINAISSNLSNDFKFSFLERKESIHIVQGITALISIAALFFSFYFNNIVDLLIQSYELSVSCLFIPIFAALFKKNGNFSSAVFSLAFGALGFCLFRIFPIALPKEVSSILLSFMGYGIGEVVAWYSKRGAMRRYE